MTRIKIDYWHLNVFSRGCDKYSCLSACQTIDLVKKSYLSPVQVNKTSCNDGLLEAACRWKCSAAILKVLCRRPKWSWLVEFRELNAVFSISKAQFIGVRTNQECTKWSNQNQLKRSSYLQGDKVIKAWWERLIKWLKIYRQQFGEFLPIGYRTGWWFVSRGVQKFDLDVGSCPLFKQQICSRFALRRLGGSASTINVLRRHPEKKLRWS